MSVAGNIAKAAFNAKTPEPSAEKFVFRRFDGKALLEAAEGSGDIDPTKVTTIKLRVNPQEVSFSEPKITQKIQTSAPGRFIVFDWGTDLLSINISGSTGNLLPAIITSGFNPMKTILDDIADTVAPGKNPPSAVASAFCAVTPYAQNVLLNSMEYHEILKMSPKYNTFVELRRMYKQFDADFDVLTLEMGDEVHRGYFMDFSFSITADNPWNWKYTINFISLVNLSEAGVLSAEEHSKYNPFIEDK